MRLRRTTVFTVTNTHNRGRGSLRTAVRRANRSRRRAPVRIEFAIGSSPATILLTSPLPRIRFHGVIDGWAQPGSAGAPGIEVNGSEAKSGIGLHVTGGEITIRGLAVTGWPANGILVHQCDDVALHGLHVGVAADGVTAAGNAGSGIHASRVTRCVVGGPGEQAVVVSGNGRCGVWFQESPDARLTGSFVGTDRRGRVAVPNGEEGVRVDASPRALLGVPDATSANVISGNGGHGILALNSPYLVLSGSRLGTDPEGKRAVPNRGSGVKLYESYAATIGGNAPGTGNLISGNGRYGVEIGGVGSADAIIVGNLIGTDATGTSALPNTRDGVVVHSSPGVRIGGPEPALRNVISGNNLYGVEIIAPEARGAILVGNYVGVDTTGRAAVPNGRSGVLIYNTSQARIGGPGPGDGNVISGGARAGINLDGSVREGHPWTGVGEAHSNVVQGNLVGVDATGEHVLGNQLRGILVNHTQNNLIVDNVVAGNGEDGILVLGPEDDANHDLVPSGNRILRNRIGVTRSGAPAGNGRHGVFVRHAKKNEIGGDTEDDGNVIANNQGRGIQFTGVGARTNFVSPHNKVADNAKGSFHQPSEDAPTAPSDRPAPGP